MPPKTRTDEEFDFDDIFDESEDDEEIEDYDEDEDYDEGDDDEDEDIDDPTFDKLRKAAEDRVIAELVKAAEEGDTDSPFYKGLQRNIAKKDKEIGQLRGTLMQLAQQVQNQGRGTQTAVNFLMEQFKDVLNDEGKQIFEDRLGKLGQQNEVEQLKSMIQAMQQPQYRGSQQSNGYDEDEELNQYIREANAQLRELVKEAGVDPKDEDLDYGDDREPIVARMKKLNASIKKVREKDEDEKVDRVRKRVSPPTTRTSAPSSGRRPKTTRGAIDDGMSEMAKKMQKAMRG